MKENVLTKANAYKGINEISMKGEIVIFGSTYMAGFPFYELTNKCNLENAVYNRSIPDLTISEAKEILQDCVLSLKPCKVFLGLGEEDCGCPDAILKYTEIVNIIRKELPHAKLYLICLTDESAYANKFNENIISLCKKDKKINYIKFNTADFSAAIQYKEWFRQMSCFFRDNSLNMANAFAMANL